MQLLLARHGNTFNPEDKVVWAGCQQDLPLVEKGRLQAKELAQRFRELSYQPEAIYCSPLQRTQQFAQIIIEELGLSIDVIIEPRLNEIDYGAWGGLSNDEIVNIFGEEKLEAWVNKSSWPEGCGWGKSQEAIAAEAYSFLQEILKHHDHLSTVLAVSSNGRLRYFLNAIPNEFERRVEQNNFKVGTGKYCRLQHQKGSWQLLDWNL